MSRITSEETISKLHKIFCRFGLLETLVSDNGTAFSSIKFFTFCQQNGINHIRTPPFHPQSNGQVERLVDTFKRALLKLREGTSEILETFLTSYRATPNPNSPAESLMNRKIRLHIDILRSKQHHSTRRNTKMERQYNHHHGDSKEILTWTTSLGKRLPEQLRNMDPRTYCTTNWKCHLQCKCPKFHLGSTF